MRAQDLLGTTRAIVDVNGGTIRSDTATKQRVDRPRWTIWHATRPTVLDLRRTRWSATGRARVALAGDWEIVGPPWWQGLTDWLIVGADMHAEGVDLTRYNGKSWAGVYATDGRRGGLIACTLHDATDSGPATKHVGFDVRGCDIAVGPSAHGQHSDALEHFGNGSVNFVDNVVRGACRVMCEADFGPLHATVDRNAFTNVSVAPIQFVGRNAPITGSCRDNRVKYAASRYDALKNARLPLRSGSFGAFAVTNNKVVTSTPTDPRHEWLQYDPIDIARFAVGIAA